jgi:hypothetical protein
MKASHVEPNLQFGGGLGWVPFNVPVDDVAASTTVTTKFMVPFRFQVAAVGAYGTGTGTVSVANVNVNGGTNIVSPTVIGIGAGAPTQPVLVGPVTNARGMGGSYVEVQVTAAGASTLENGMVTVWIRPYPMKGEA